MALSVGTRLGPYEITAPLGAGGMGEVYRARDTKLSRFVAIKILPEVFSSDSEYRERFAREARTLAALSHPNILAIHDLATEGDIHYLVCELLEGETLRQRLEKGPLALRKSVELAVELANGIAAAHEKGIIHRDLKPENVFLTKDSRVKILDFGVAKQIGFKGEGATASLVAGRTQDGIVLGTVGYMSPEQVRGRAADERSDIFSFGLILYEMVTGQRAFKGDSAVEVMNAILKEEPSEITNLESKVPSGLWLLINRCVEKNPAHRFQAARDLGFALEAVASGSTSLIASHVARPKRYVRGAVIFMLTGLLLFFAYMFGHRANSSRFSSLPIFHRLTFRPGTVLAARFGPDGRTIVYGGKFDGIPSRLYVTTADSPESRALETLDVSLLAVSDSGELAVVRGCRHEAMLVDCHGTLARMPVAGGAPRDVMAYVEAADWLPKSDQLAVAHQVGGISQVEFPIGHIVYQTAGWISSIRVSPNSAELGIAEHSTMGSDGGAVLIVDRQGRKQGRTRPFPSVEGIAWAPSGDELWFVASPENEGWANELHSLNDSGREQLIWRFQGMSRLHDIFRDGRMLVSRENWRENLSFRGIHDTEEKNLSWFDLSELVDLAPDGSEVLLLEGGEAPAVTDLYLRKTDGSPAIRLGGGDWGARSRDGNWVVATSYLEHAELSIIPTGVGTRKAIPPTDFIKGYQQPEFLPDGRHILFLATDGQTWRFYTQDVEGGNPVAVTPEIGQPYARPFQMGSPDGKYVWNRDLQGRLAIYALDGSAPRPVPGLTPDDIPANWGRDSSHVYIYRNDFPVQVYMLDMATGKRTAVTQFNPRDPIGLEGVRGLRVTPDGRFGAYSYIRALSELYLVRDFPLPGNAP